MAGVVVWTTGPSSEVGSLFPPVALEVEKNHVKCLDVKEVRRLGPENGRKGPAGGRGSGEGP